MVEHRALPDYVRFPNRYVVSNVGKGRKKMNQFKKAKIFLVTALLLLQLILSACSGRSTPNTGPSLKKNLMSKKPVYTVTFDINGGTLVSGELEQQVTEGSAATAPIVEKENHKLTWDRNFENITSDILITAQWEKQN